VFASSQVGVITSPIEGITTSLGKRAQRQDGGNSSSPRNLHARTTSSAGKMRGGFGGW